MRKNVDLLEILLDEDHNYPVIFIDPTGKELLFDQVATIPMRVGHEKRLYCIIKPREKIRGIADNEAIVFRVDVDEEENTVLRLEEEEEIAQRVFKKYYQLLMASQGISAKDFSITESMDTKEDLKEELAKMFEKIRSSTKNS